MRGSKHNLPNSKLNYQVNHNSEEKRMQYAKRSINHRNFKI